MHILDHCVHTSVTVAESMDYDNFRFAFSNPNTENGECSYYFFDWNDGGDDNHNNNHVNLNASMMYFHTHKRVSAMTSACLLAWNSIDNFTCCIQVFGLGRSKTRDRFKFAAKYMALIFWTNVSTSSQECGGPGWIMSAVASTKSIE